VVQVGDKQAVYDRWGFCSENSDALDQAGIVDTIAWLINIDLSDI
jgi:hypothetical protein